MNKREFLAMGGAVPLMLAGCGGNSAGSASVRLVNASRGYPNLGFMVETTQATSSDVAYGATSPFETVQGGAVTMTLTVANASATAPTTRTLNKDQRYSLVAYGFINELKSVLITESTVAPDAGMANINVLNTSVDIGAVDVYLSTGTDLSISTLIASSITGVSQSAFASVEPGSYFVTVVGAGSIAKGVSDVRFQSPAAIALVNQQILTVIVTPGDSGVLANAIMLTQGTAGTPVSYLNTTARVRAVTAVGGKTVSVAGVLQSNTTSQYSNYVVVNTGAPPVVTVDGATLATTQTLDPGSDYTLMVYLDGSNNPTMTLIKDINTAPATSSGVKFRLINLVSNNQGLSLSMSVNSISVASTIAYGAASVYTEVTTPQTTNSIAEIFNGADLLTTHSQVMTVGNIFTEIVVGVDPGTGAVKDFFRSASGT
jgi:hypothetical protein